MELRSKGGNTLLIPGKIDSISTTVISDKGVDSIVDWFDEHKQSFYILGYSYLSNQIQLEELFYRTIIQVQKDLSRFTGKTSFKMWVTSIFIEICRELSVDRSFQTLEESEPRQNLFKALNQLKEHEKEAIILTYVQRFSNEEVAQLLKVSVGKMKELMYSGVQLLSNEMRQGITLQGCKEYKKDYIDYLERVMERPKKIDFEVHIYHCQKCQEELAAIQDVMLTMFNLTDKIEDLHVPFGFIENIKERLVARESHIQKKNKRRKRKVQVIASILALLFGIGAFTGAFSHFYYSWTEEDPELRAFLQEGVAQRLNLEVESAGVKMKIKSVIADEFQTLVFYEIIDTVGGNQYVLNYGDGVFVVNRYEIMNRSREPRYYPPDLESEVNNKEKNVYHGKLSLWPLKTANGTIKFSITNLQKLNRTSSVGDSLIEYENMEMLTGDWSVDIPVTKQPSTEYALDKETEVEGVPVRFHKLTIAPTATILQFGINNNQQLEKEIMSLNFNSLEVNNKEVKPDIYGSAYFYLDAQSEKNWTTMQTQFDPVFIEKPKQVDIQLGSAYLSVNDNKIIELDSTRGFPQTFEYVGSTISIDKLEVGQSTEFVMSNYEIENRAYEMFYVNIIRKDEKIPVLINMNSEGVFVDKKGVKYDINEPNFSFEKIEQPRYFNTVQSVEFHGNDVLPEKLEIFKYSTTKYLDDVVKIFLE